MKIPTRIFKRINYILQIKHKTHTIYILIILLHWIYGYAYFTGSSFYYNYINQVQAQTQSKNVVGSGDMKNKELIQGSKEWIKEQWTDAGAEWVEVWAVVQGESGWNSEAWNCNSNNSLDAGFYQLNSVHDITLSCATDKVCATGEAIELWKAQGWNPWVAAKKLGIR